MDKFKENVDFTPKFQTNTFLSELPDAINVSEDDRQQHKTISECPVNCCFISPVLKSHMINVVSWEPDTLQKKQRSVHFKNILCWKSNLKRLEHNLGKKVKTITFEMIIIFVFTNKKW